MRFRTSAFCFAFLILAAPAVAEWPCWELAQVDIAAPEPVTLMVLPDGGGDTLDNAFNALGTRMDATISVTLFDCSGLPIANFPAEDIWLETIAHGLAACLSGTHADAATDATGRTTWSGPLRGGGYDDSGCLVVVNGSYLPVAPLPVTFNSPDISGDRVVNLLDVPTFAGDFFGTYHFRSDLQRDGAINLSDLVRFALALGADCP